METIRFVEMMDRFFDCMKVNNFSTATKKKKLFQSPYTSVNDFRLTVCNTVIVCILNLSRHTIVGRAAKSGARQTSVYYTGTK